ncbi:hypothetical protein [Nocardioides jishulii]|uniref:Uncharacterized protein n=1 Tax=Nocardioides jishulii TaxID=2575440 RepID=A0A4U2YNN9_9ACTN|nr:hypothetical protein [Nocardioides jishulii]QCX27667.1 hypothetical protein FCL41_09130 [Nocardioides jishulii]TKI62474.1 hypothetical protein FC770_08795 [Nocardioides jishulii]
MYGHSSAAVRDAVGELLHHQRLTKPIGAVHILDDPRFDDYRDDLALITRYRQVLLGWCCQLARITTAYSLPGTAGESSSSPARDLHEHLRSAYAHSPARAPSMDELTTPASTSVVEIWRTAARAAVLAEVDFNPTLAPAALSAGERIVMLKDIADVTHALVSLERRYRTLPGWLPLDNTRRLGRSAHLARLFADAQQVDYAIDHRGQRPCPGLMADGERTGIAGLLAAEHNLYVQLVRHFPDATTLRLVLDSQRLISAAASEIVTEADPDLTHLWAARAETYRLLTDHTRDLGGQIGHGAPAAREALILGTRLRMLGRPTMTPAQVDGLANLFNRVDARIAEIVRTGARQDLYFLRVPIPRIDTSSPGLTKPVRHRYAPLSAVGSDMVELVTSRFPTHGTQATHPAHAPRLTLSSNPRSSLAHGSEPWAVERSLEL